MQNAKRMVLVEERLLDWKRPIEQRAKTVLHKQLRNDLNNEIIPDDQKAKQYQHNLSRFLKTKNRIVEEPIIKQEFELPKPVKRPAVQKAPKGKKIKLSQPIRKSKRVPKKPIKWDPWN